MSTCTHWLISGICEYCKGDFTITIKEAMWAGDIATLNKLAPCKCCCNEHTYGLSCPAWTWAGCRGYNENGLTTHQDELVWKAHYEKFHGMTEKQFYGYET